MFLPVSLVPLLCREGLSFFAMFWLRRHLGMRRVVLLVCLSWTARGAASERANELLYDRSTWLH